MPLRELQDSLEQSEWVRSQYVRVLTRSILVQFQNIMSLGSGDVVWAELLGAASVLAQSDKGEHQEIALRIAQECLTDNRASDTERDAAAIVLDQLANRRAIHLAMGEAASRNLSARLGITGLIEWTRRGLDNSVLFSDGTAAAVNRFQRDFWEETSHGGWVSASAPTSAGKSFILMRRIIELIATNPLALVIYICPTRALVHEVESELRALTHDGVNRANVTSLPLLRSLKPSMANVFVLTQERLHLLYSRVTSRILPDMLIVDEAHKIGEGQRGVLLQQAVDRVVSSNLSVAVIYVTPQTENPEALLTDSPADVRSMPLPSEVVTVNQNLLWVTQVPGDVVRWLVKVCVWGEFVDVGEVSLRDRPDKASKRLTLIAYEMGRDSVGNLVYANRPSDAEKTAKQLFELIGQFGPHVTDESAIIQLAELADLASKTVHARFNLIPLLSRGVAFHYGNMPFLLRSEIERLFRDGVIRFLVCTSTLVEGVNLACRNIFLRGPKRGKQPMTDADFWNLAGRAGRWGRDRAGNIVCVDAETKTVWHGRTAPVRKVKQRITRATETVLSQHEKVLAFILADTPRSEAGKNPALEHTTAYLMSLQLSGQGLAATRWGRNLPLDVVQSIDAATRDALIEFPVRPDVVARNPGISPLAMKSLLESFRKRKGKASELLPILPEDDSAVDVYYRIFRRIGRTLTTLFSNDARTYVLALLTVNWMRGFPLPRLIDAQIRYQRTRFERQQVENGTAEAFVPDYPNTIRDIMRDVEEIARFAAPKYLGCYVDVLRQFLDEAGDSSALEAIGDLQVLLEYGVSTNTELSLLAIGLSRTSAVMVAELMMNTNRDEQSCLEWLREQDLSQLEVPAAVRREVGLILRVSEVRTR